jgi:hypothetical protein
MGTKHAGCSLGKPYVFALIVGRLLNPRTLASVTPEIAYSNPVAPVKMLSNFAPEAS